MAEFTTFGVELWAYPCHGMACRHVLLSIASSAWRTSLHLWRHDHCRPMPARLLGWSIDKYWYFLHYEIMRLRNAAEADRRGIGYQPFHQTDLWHSQAWHPSHRVCSQARRMDDWESGNSLWWPRLANIGNGRCSSTESLPDGTWNDSYHLLHCSVRHDWEFLLEARRERNVEQIWYSHDDLNDGCQYCAVGRSGLGYPEPVRQESRLHNEADGEIFGIGLA
mmetsp:Transcript_4022/g.6570  ORF Transcript_4022/g.6570 Transcript_4022/m.6570 type:complete len:222 (-) Transcript_4022:855-1520(-)